MIFTKDPTHAQAKTLIPHIPEPDFGRALKEEEMKVTWLGHACVLVEFPVLKGGAGAAVPGPKRGVRVLFDPVLGPGMAFWGLGPKRQSSTPCTIPSLPQVDIIAISHNHYDHLDVPTLETLFSSQMKEHGSEPVLFLPLNNKHVVSSLNLGEGSTGGKIVELDWWEGRKVAVEGVGEVEMTCTPCQHTSARYLWDRDNSLWSSWVARDANPVQKPTSVFFGGDTGYCKVHSHSSFLPPPPSLPHCPAFKQIGDRLGPFTLGLIPIGAYFPRDSMSGMHAAPGDSVRIFTDTKCKQALGIHWGTFRMTPERFTEPPEMLEAAVREAGLEPGVFGVCAIGESRGYSG
ncbi:hypothetical protein IAR50_005361 [Cryptococcus sp. DSM 104548]